jgi:hypothetical protein
VAAVVNRAGGPVPESDSTWVRRSTRAKDGRELTEAALCSVSARSADTLLARPGEEIVLPFRTYPVNWSTARVVKGFNVRTRSSTYRIPDGLMMEIRADSETVAAVIIGDGRTDQGEGSDRPFHYLYVRGSPEHLSPIVQRAGEVDVDREALEDARALHEWHFSHVGFLSARFVHTP